MPGATTGQVSERTPRAQYPTEAASRLALIAEGKDRPGRVRGPQKPPLPAVAAEIGLGPAIEILSGERARVRTVIGR
jgi:hypothetical protein